MKKLLVAPLDWGLGHATRCIPIVRKLIDSGHEVHLAGDGPHIDLLRSEFHGIRTVPLINYKITYSSSRLGTFAKFPWMLGRVFKCAAEEHRRVEYLVEQHGYDGIVSDQRFGCRSARVPSVYLTHQLRLKMPPGFGPLEPIISYGLRWAASQYTEIWIPDYPGEDNLTGELSHRAPLPKRRRYIGPLSRFGSMKKNGRNPPDLLVVLSGPEPQRTIFEKTIRKQLRNFPGDSVVLLGRPDTNFVPESESNVRIIPHLPTGELGKLLQSSKSVVCRGGYTTIMELVSSGRKAVLVPTPGQTEQEYLCRRLAAQQRFVCRSQKSFNLSEALSALSRIPTPRSPIMATDLLSPAVDAIFGTSE